MKPSRFNLFYPLDDKSYAAYNSRTGSFLHVTNECFQALSEGLSTGVNTLTPSLKYVLAEFGFIVKDELDELRALRNELFNRRFDRRGLGITVAPTLGCNLRCIYCYEASVRAPEHMSPEVEEALINYISTQVPEGGSLSLGWYGGEPLIMKDFVLRVSRAAKTLAVNKKLRNFGLSMVTNGTLLEQSLVTELDNLGLRSIQITIDGPAEVHDSRKPFASGKGSSFEAIVGNLASIDFGNIGVSVRCNIDKSNAEVAPSILSELAQRKVKNISAYAAPVVPWPGVACRDGGDDIYFSGPEFAQIRQKFDATARALGYRAGSRPMPKGHYCGGDSAAGFTLGPDGSMFKCWNHVGDTTLAVGNLLFGTEGPNAITDWTHYDPTSNPTCSSCSLLPICLGGCPERARTSAKAGERSCDLFKFEMHQILKEWAADWSRGAICQC